MYICALYIVNLTDIDYDNKPIAASCQYCGGGGIQ